MGVRVQRITGTPNPAFRAGFLALLVLLPRGPMSLPPRFSDGAASRDSACLVGYPPMPAWGPEAVRASSRVAFVRAQVLVARARCAITQARVLVDESRHAQAQRREDRKKRRPRPWGC